MTVIILLCVIALTLVFFEVLLPGGILGIFALIAWLTATYLAYAEYGIFGAVVVFGGTLVVGTISTFVEFKLLGKTKFGGSFFLRTQLSGGNSVGTARSAESLIGKHGETLTRLNPSGMIRVDGARFEARCVDGFLEQGETVEILSKDSFRLIVKKL